MKSLQLHVLTEATLAFIGSWSLSWRLIEWIKYGRRSPGDPKFWTTERQNFGAIPLSLMMGSLFDRFQDKPVMLSHNRTNAGPCHYS
jgi:hypothetical protein